MRPCPFCENTSGNTERYRKSVDGSVLIGLKTDASMIRCRACRSLYLNYVPSCDELRELYGERFRYPDAPTQATLNSYKAVLRGMARHACSESRRLLEVGCAGGNWLQAADALGWECEGNDLNAEMLSQLHEKHGFPVHLGFFEDLDFPRPFDAVVAVNVFEHLNDPESFVAKVGEVLEPGGLFCMKTPLADTWAERWEGYRWPHLAELGHLLFGSRQAIVEMFSRHDLELVQFQSAGFPPSPRRVIQSRRGTIDVSESSESVQTAEGVVSKGVPTRSWARRVLANSQYIKPLYFKLNRLLQWGDSSYWTFRRASIDPERSQQREFSNRAA